MICLGLESTAHTFGAGIFDGKARANEKDMYKAVGIHPREASQYMTTNAPAVIKKALSKAGITLEDVDVFAFSRGPGLGPCLRVSSVLARTFSEYFRKPLVGVNHCIAHVEVGKWEKRMKDPLVIYVSGANTQILGLAGGKYRVYGETLDMGLGNALDTFAREYGIPLPGGAEIERLAEGGKLMPMPYTVKGMDLAFSGLLTAAKKAAKTHSKKDVCYSLQENAFTMLVEVSERALAHTKKKELMLVGGVAQNKRLRSMLEEMCRDHKAEFGVPENEYNADNGLMIALTGWKMAKAGITGAGPVDQKWRTDDVDVSW
ncbi:MAG: bifunctional N(6)-L-threonylcarbamoyladenine synthase/serine/threonine protein kinase [Candidatus Diapherotrites archaeon]|nr:bifunctional N(6)-L-threonylcarbamoyladenine synthase/serine/threonine protein kinase [Candidatus Diapherotrites archaeon]